MFVAISIMVAVVIPAAARWGRRWRRRLPLAQGPVTVKNRVAKLMIGVYHHEPNESRDKQKVSARNQIGDQLTSAKQKPPKGSNLHQAWVGFLHRTKHLLRESNFC